MDWVQTALPGSMKTKQPPVELSILRFCGAMAVSRETVIKGLNSAGVKVEDAKQYPLRQLVSSITADGKAERARLTKAQADMEEIKVEKLRRTLIELQEVVIVVRGILQPVRDALVTFPQAMAARCNASDPTEALTELRNGVDNILRGLHDAVLPEILDQLLPLVTDGRGKKKGKK